MSTPLFAAPTTSTAQTAGGGIAEVMLALIVIVALIGGLAWAMKRMRRLTSGGQARIQVLSDQVMGPKERCVLVRVGDTDILIGVAQGSVNTLHVFPPGANTEAPAAPPASGPAASDFKALLMRSLGK